MKTIPIASGKVDAAMKAAAFDRVAEALAAGEIVCIFPEGRLTDTGEMNAFRPGVQAIVARTPVPVYPMALSGLWGSFFSRASQGRAMQRMRGVFSRIAISVGAPLAPADATPERLQQAVLALRGATR